MTETVLRPTEPEGAADGPWEVPASYAQERVWLTGQLAPGVPLFRVTDWIRLAYPVDAATVVGALGRVVDRHETLRTCFRVDDGALLQVIHPSVPVTVPQVDLADLAEADRQRWMRKLLHEMARAPLPLDRAPLWRAQLVRCGPGEWFLLFMAHHTIADAAAQLNLHAELKELCAAAAESRAASLPDLPIQYADYAVWQRERLSGDRLERLLGYWREALAGLPPVHALPTDRPRPAERTFTGAELEFSLPESLVSGVAALARRRSATPFMAYLAAYAALLHRLSGRDDIVVGVPVSGRDRPQLRPVIGMFVNVVVVRVDTSGDPSFTDLLDRVRHTTLAAFEHGEMPLQKLVEAVAGPRDPRVPPLYQLGFNQLAVGTGTSHGGTEDDLALEVSGSTGRLEYNTALFEAETAHRFVDQYLDLLAAAVADPETRLAALPAAGLTGGQVYAAPRSTTPAEYVAPRTAAEELVAEVWAEVLGVERVGVLDDFFDLGGHSLLALRVTSRLSAATEIDVPIGAFFAGPTVAALAAELERLLAAEIDQLSEEEAERLVAEQGRGA